MEALRLTLALLLPWWLGLQLLNRWRFEPPPALALRASIAFFLGWLVITTLLRLAYLLGTPPFATTLSLGLTLGVALRLTNHPSSRPSGSTSWGLPSLAMILLAIWVGLHLAPTLLEALTRPLYPWDAWDTWVYRAKIWFYQGELVPFYPPGKVPPGGYELEAWDYPLFASLVPLWPAVALDHWSETLIGLPGWTTALAIALGLYGAARLLALPPPWSLLIASVYLSIPLVNSHMALPGYADLWMSGFAGLGLVLLLIPTGRGFQSLGLLLLTASLFIKKEGIVWLTVGLIYLAIAHRPRWALAILLLLGTVIWLIPQASVHIPFLGTWGWADHQLLLGKWGSYSLAFQDVNLPLFKSFFLQGSWNLLWLAAACAFLLGLIRLKNPQYARPLLMLLCLAAPLFVIFFLSSQSQWARDFTAINRLPLQVLPAWLMSCVLLLWRPWRRADQSS